VLVLRRKEFPNFRSNDMSRNMIDGLWNDESGSTAFDYGLIAAVLSIVVVTAISANGSSLSSLVEQAFLEIDRICTG
jgi:pilus assembly protein Flp/PilA